MAHLTKGVELYMKAFDETKTVAEQVAGVASTDKVANLQEYPDLLGNVETVDVTTLDDDFRHYIPGIRDVGGAMGFTFLYEKTIFSTFNTAKDTHQLFQVKFPDGVKFSWGGYVVPSIMGKGVNDAIQFSANITADTDFEVTFPV